MASLEKQLSFIGFDSKAHEWASLLSEGGVSDWKQLLNLRHKDFLEKGTRWRELEVELFCNLSYLQARMETVFFNELLEDGAEIIQTWPGYDLLQKREAARPLVTRLHELEEATRRGEDLFVEKLRGIDGKLAQLYVILYFLRTFQIFLQKCPEELPVGSYNFSIGFPLRKQAQALIQSKRKPWIEHLSAPQVVMTHPHLLWAKHDHQGIVTAIAACKNIILSASEDATLRVWDIVSGECYHVLQHEGSPVRSIALTDSAALSGDDSGKVRVWNTFTGLCTRAFQAHSEQVTALAISEDATLALSGSVDGEIKLWNLNTGECPYVFKEHQGRVSALQFGQDGKLFYSASSDRSIKRWDCASGKCLRTLGSPLVAKPYEVNLGYHPPSSCSHADDVTSFALGEPYVISGCRDKKARLWHLASGICQLTMHGHAGPISAVAITADSKFGISCSADDTLRLWDLHSGQALRSFKAHSIALNALCVTRDQRMVFTAGWDHSLKCWDIWTGQAPTDLLAPHYTQSVDMQAGWALCAHRDSTIGLWDVDKRKWVGVLEGHAAEVKMVRFLDHAGEAISLDAEGVLRIWDLNTRRALHVFKEPGVCIQAFYPQADKILWMGADHSVRSWKRGASIASIVIAHVEHATASVLTPNAELILGCADGSIVSYPGMEAGRREVWQQTHFHPITSLQMTPDGAYLVVGHADGALGVYRGASREQLHLLRHHPGAIRALAFHSNHRWAISVDSQGWLILWDLVSGEIQARDYSTTPWTSLTHMRTDGLFMAATESGLRFLQLHL